MFQFKFFIAVMLYSIVIGCGPKEVVDIIDNPAAEGFNEMASDGVAISLADNVMVAMGGRKAWDETEYIKWNFFGSRRHVWNKRTGDVVIEGLKDSFLVKMNINDMKGSVNYHGVELTEADSLQKYLEKGKNMWINDAYWLIMPYKLKDSGVTLKYVGRDTTEAGVLSEVVSLSFEEVGKTPENKYLVYIDTASHWVTQWDFYTQALDTVPRFKTPWIDYKKYGEIWLSGNRGPKYDLTEIAVGDSLSRYFK